MFVRVTQEKTSMLFALSCCFLALSFGDENVQHRDKRSAQAPKLDMTVTYGNVTPVMNSGSTFYYRVSIKHAQESSADAQGTKVQFMLTPYVRFKEITKHTTIKPTPVVKDDSVTMKLGEVIWSSEPFFEFTVSFNDKSSLQAGKHHVVTHAQITYYNQYAEDAQGVVTSKGDFYKSPLKSMAFQIEIPGCTGALGMTSKEIKDFQLGASSSYAEAQPSQAREFDDGWCAHISNTDQYLQIDFTNTKRVTGISTIRRNSKPHWVTEYFISYSMDGVQWTEYNENGFTKRFKGNTISFDSVFHWFSTTFHAISVRIRPTKWEVLICMRLELFGCTIKGSGDTCMKPLGMESGKISDQALSDKRATVPSMDMVQPRNSRLNAEVVAFPYGWMSNHDTEYLQIDLGSLYRVTRVALQGGYTTMASTMFFTKTYKIKYSNNSLTWYDYMENGLSKVIQGSKDRFDAKHAKIASLKPIAARYVRLYPILAGDAGMKVMRVELYGCLQDPEPLYKGITDLQYYRRSFLVDPNTDQFLICMYIDNRAESSCLATNDSKEWRALDPNIIAVIAANPHDKEVYGLDRLMNLYRTRDSGMTWYQISREYYDLAAKDNIIYQAKGIPDNFVSSLPTANTTIATSTGAKWGVSSAYIHFKTAGGNAWSTVGSWKCCGM